MAMHRLARRVAAIAWPAFMVAGVLEIGVFAFVDPQSLHTLNGTSLNISATAVYSLAFVFFWICASVACLLTVALERSAEEVNSRTFS
jgi:hypothetical protein